MAEPVVNIDQEIKLVDYGQEEETAEENREDDAKLETNTSLLAGLNLVLILSFLSLSAEECPNFDETQEMESGDYNYKAKHGVSRSSFQTRRRQVNQFPAVERQTSKALQKIM
ncbi:hypothetical protein Pfo_001111, partial [Paulownia fortunei]